MIKQRLEAKKVERHSAFVFCRGGCPLLKPFLALILACSVAGTLAPRANAQSFPFARPDSPTGTLWADRLTADWGGSRPSLLEHGVTVKSWYVGVGQAPVSGGGRRRASFGSKFDVYMAIDGEKVGLWKGLTIEARGEGRIGDAATRDLSVFLPTAYTLSVPASGDSIGLPLLKLSQRINSRLTLTGGRFVALEGYITPFADGMGDAEFMHAALMAKPVLSGQMSYSAWTVGAIVRVRKEMRFKWLVQDPHNVPTTTGFDTLAHEGVSFLWELTFPTNLGGRYGFHTFDVTWSNKPRTSLDRNDAVIPPGGGVIPGVKRRSWSGYYQIGQYLHGDTTRGWGFFGQIAAGDANPNPLAWFVHAGLGGVGSFGRPGDRWGAGYFNASTSNTLRDALRPVLPVRSEQGFETYYNFALGRGFHLSPDFEVVRPADGRRGWTAIPGLRLLVEF